MSWELETNLGQALTLALGRPLVVHLETGEPVVWILYPTARRLAPAEGRAVIDRLVGMAAQRRKTKKPNFNAASTRAFLSASGLLCRPGGAACPECLERRALESLFGGATVDEFLAVATKG